VPLDCQSVQEARAISNSGLGKLRLKWSGGRPRPPISREIPAPGGRAPLHFIRAIVADTDRKWVAKLSKASSFQASRPPREILHKCHPEPRRRRRIPRRRSAGRASAEDPSPSSRLGMTRDNCAELPWWSVNLESCGCGDRCPSGHSAAYGGASGALRRRDRWGQRSPHSAIACQVPQVCSW